LVESVTTDSESNSGKADGNGKADANRSTGAANKTTANATTASETPSSPCTCGVNTDDPSVIDCTLNSEWLLCLEKMKLSRSDLKLCTMMQLDSCFIGLSEKKRYREVIEKRWPEKVGRGNGVTGDTAGDRLLDEPNARLLENVGVGASINENTIENANNRADSRGNSIDTTTTTSTAMFKYLTPPAGSESGKSRSVPSSRGSWEEVVQEKA
jgi:hypothetical protein